MKKISLISKKENEFKYAIGVMTGTSMDGVDVLLVKIKGTGIKTRYSEEIFESFDIPAVTASKMRSIISEKRAGLEDICLLNYEISKLYHDSISRLCKKHSFDKTNIDFIAVSGQTFFHVPGRATLQLGDGAYLSELAGVPVVWDFRASDIAAGGQGAPLVPYLDHVLFSKLKKNVMPLNIGGISNITYIPSGGDFNKVIAFDCGPGNMIIDRLVIEYSAGRVVYDKDSRIAAAAEFSETIFKFLLAHPYLEKYPPKSTGREDFGDHYVRSLIAFGRERGICVADMIRTATEFTAYCVAEAVKKWILPKCRENDPEKKGAIMPCAGGGAKNPMILKKMSEMLLPHKVSVVRSEELGVSPASKEALLMAVLGNETLYLKPSNVPSATGAGKGVITGTVSIPAVRSAG